MHFCFFLSQSLLLWLQIETPAFYIQARFLPVVAIVLVYHTLGLLIEGGYRRVAPPMVKVSVLVILATCSEKASHAQII